MIERVLIIFNYLKQEKVFDAGIEEIIQWKFIIFLLEGIFFIFSIKDNLFFYKFWFVGFHSSNQPTGYKLLAIMIR